MKNTIICRILLALGLIIILLFADYPDRVPHDNALKNLIQAGTPGTEKRAQDYATLNKAEVFEVYKDNYRTFSYNKNVFSLDFQEESSGYTTIFITAMELPVTPAAEKETLLIVGTTGNTEDYEKYTEPEELLSFQEAFTQKLCQKIFLEEERLEIMSEGYEYSTGNLVEYHMELSDGSYCYAKVVCFDEVITYTLLRESAYSEVLNPYYHDVYLTITEK